MEKKKESVAPNVMDAIDEAARKTRKKLRTIADWQKELEAETTPKKKPAAEDGHDGAAE
jgi:BMFP domain-containing protein YqiC